MNKKFFSRLTIFGMAFALVLALGTINVAKAVPGFNENLDRFNEDAPTTIGQDVAGNATLGNVDADRDHQMDTQPYGLFGKSDM